MFRYPYRWFVNITGLLEKRQFSPYAVVLFCLFAGAVRILEEWALGGRGIFFSVAEVGAFISFYWLAYFAYGLVLRALVPAPWNKSINVVLIGIFLGVFPPLIDVFVYGLGQRIPYRFVRDFPGGWRLAIYNPEHGIPLGEAVVLWATIVFTALYVAHKTRSFWRTLAAAAAGYGIVVFIGAVLATLVSNLVTALDWQPSRELVLLTLAQWLLPVFLYGLLQPKVAGGLIRRTLHALPFVLVCLGAAALAKSLGVAAWAYAGLLLVVFWAALVQNDYFDRDEDQGRSGYADAAAMQFFTVLAWGAVVILGAANTGAAVILALVLALAHLYSFPYYRAKRFFPGNLKIEGMWGLLSFLLGILAAVETHVFSGPRWAPFGGMPDETAPTFRGLSEAELVVALLVFGGFSLMAALKDAKDVAADQAAGNQTLYTLLSKAGRSTRALHRGLVLAAAGGLTIAPILLVAAGRVTPLWLPYGIVFAVGAWFALGGSQPGAAFRRFLWVLSLYLAGLIVALQLGVT